MTTTHVDPTTLRARFAARLSDLYGTEVPAYTTLLEVSQEVNRRVLERDGADAERLGSIERVTAERHGAIRVGSPEELAQVARIFGALATGAVANADLSFATRREAEAAPQRARDRVLLETAVGILAADLHTGVDAAEQHLRDAAARAGVSLLQLATAIVRSREAQRRDDD